MQDKLTKTIEDLVKKAYQRGYTRGYYDRVLEDTKDMVKEMKGKYKE